MSGPVRLYSPTGRGVRGVDEWGSGAFGASRDGGVRRHAGTDFVATPDQVVTAPCGGVVTRRVRCYADTPRWQGLEIDAGWGLVKLLYVEPRVAPGVRVSAGEPIGVAQDLRARYPGITPHVHLEVALGAVGAVDGRVNPLLWLVGGEVER